MPNQPESTTENWIALSAKIAAHELGHLVGLLHQDSYGPIGYGIHAPPGANRYLPTYPGYAAAFETFDHLMSSPASVGSNRHNDVRDLFFGEREAIKLAFAESGWVLQEQVGFHRSIATAQGITWNALNVPNTLGSGMNFGKTFAVDAVAVVGQIGLTAAGVSESDFYAISGRQGDVLNIEVFPTALSRLAGNTIDPIVRIYDSQGNLVSYYGAPAINDDGFEPTDATIIDLILPSDGTYYVEVDTWSSLTGLTRTSAATSCSSTALTAAMPTTWATYSTGTAATTFSWAVSVTIRSAAAPGRTSWTAASATTRILKPPQ